MRKVLSRISIVVLIFIFCAVGSGFTFPKNSLYELDKETEISHQIDEEARIVGNEANQHITQPTSG